MDQPSLGHRLNRALLALGLRAQGPSVDPTKNGLGTSISTGKNESTAPPRYDDDHGAWYDRAERVVLALEIELAGPRARTPRTTTKDLLTVIRQYEGRSMPYVAFLEGCSTDLVKKVRTIIGVLPADGTKPPKPLTTRDLPQDTSSQIPSGVDDIGYIPSSAAPETDEEVS